MKVYRVQNALGQGCYTGGVGTTATSTMGWSSREWALSRRLGPLYDFESLWQRLGFKETAYHEMERWLKDWLFAFPSEEAAYRWFPKRSMEFMAERGFVLVALEAEEVHISDSGDQCIFRARRLEGSEGAGDAGQAAREAASIESPANFDGVARGASLQFDSERRILVNVAQTP